MPPRGRPVSAMARKWRPPMALVVLVVCVSLLAVPLVALFALQIGTNWFVRETESSLIKQAAIYASAYSAAFEAAARGSEAPVSGYYLPPDKRVFWSAETRTFQAFLNLRTSAIEPTRPDAVPSEKALDARYREIADGLGALERRAGRTTLSNVVFLDFQGLDLLAETSMSFAAVPEVERALRGELGVALRWRSDADEKLSFLSFARGSGFRVLVAYPVISFNRVVGAIYISRTPPRLDSFFSEEGVAFVVLIGVTLLGTAVMGAFLVGMVLRPLRQLRDQARLVARGAEDGLVPLDRYGMREIAEMGDAVLTMAARLSQRTKEIGIYTNHVTHELKSPVTSIIGAAELLDEGDLPEETQRKLLGAIKGQGERMARLLAELREMAQSRQFAPGEPGTLGAMLPMAEGFEVAASDPNAALPMSVAHGKTVLAHLAQNALQHGADRLELTWDGKTLRVSDNGEGFGDVDIDRLSEPFFTTRRDAGGTGLGLAIVVAILDLYRARLRPEHAQGGAVFAIEFP